MDEDVTVLEVADPSNQESLDAEAEVDPMEGEQTWPTQEELDAADGRFHFCEDSGLNYSKRIILNMWCKDWQQVLND